MVDFSLRDFCFVMTQETSNGEFVRNILDALYLESTFTGSNINGYFNPNQPNRTFGPIKKFINDCKNIRPDFKLPADIPKERLHYLYRYLYNESTANKSDSDILYKIFITALNAPQEKQETPSEIDYDEFWSNQNFSSDEALKEFLANLHTTPSDILTPNISTSKEPKEIAEAWFKAKRSTGRYNGYFETRHGSPIHNLRNKLAIDEMGEYSLLDILFPQGKDHKNSVNLLGCGGSGKSYQIFHCIDDIFSGKTTDDELNELDITQIVKNIIPIYIPLNSLKDDNENCIVSFLVKEVWQMQSTFEDIVKILHNNAENVLIFADGLNEITNPNMRKKIAKDICDLRQLHRTRFLVSSRIDHTDIFNSLNYGSDQIFTKAKVLDLSQKQIDTYFSDVHCVARYKDVPVNTRKLLKTPQGCVMFADYVGSHTGRIKKIESLGQL